ncbi:MAG: UDP-glucose 4-epimerase GalE [Armatimonadetes bacterium]|nr:UDP-glucose 4-epimerase GalE [Armatimonadota bacterium]
MCKALEAAGEPFFVLDNLERGHEAALRGARLVRCDLRDRDAVAEVFRQNDIEAVIHFAAYIEVGESVSEPARFYENNVVGTWNLLEAMRSTGVGRLVFSSTAAVYGEPDEVPIPESHPKRPTNPYGETKLAVEGMLRWYEAAHGIRSVALRYFNAAGSDPDGEIGEDHRPETHLIPRILLSVLGRADFKVFGDDYDTPDGTCVRDYVHVCDLCAAHLGALRYLGAGGTTAAFNLGNGVGFSVQEVVDVVAEVTGRRLEPEVAPRRSGDPARLVASSGAARTALGWAPEHGRLDEIVGTAWGWFRSRPSGYGD